MKSHTQLALEPPLPDAVALTKTLIQKAQVTNRRDRGGGRVQSDGAARTPQAASHSQ